MRRRHPAFLAARVLTGLIAVTPVNHDAIDRFIEAKAAEEEGLSSVESDWRERYDKLAEDALEVYSIVYGQLTDPARNMDPEDRIAAAANELHWAAKRLEARGIFNAADL